MNLKKLREAEDIFLHRYPGGFDNEEMQQIAKKHNVGKLVDHAANVLARKQFSNQARVLDDIVKIVSRSSMVSMFEKPRFRDFVNGLGRDDRAFLAAAFKRLLHGKQERGFTDIVDVLSEGKLAKWSLVTICSLYYHPNEEVFVKPTTTKNVIRQFELDHLVYHPRPTWDFYQGYRTAIETMKAHVHPSLSPNNAAFTGFLMMTTSVDR
ncbi:MAG: hypothetical protein QF921_08980 [Pseudomonadales bacterium]|jgi:hypothetical protein|nr:hypothetical protein [Pseudomonadales bacterium]MDP6471155.1 hypothetical protein [Pseudomonadales bacterium]MDP6825658.1 hypothetical protein [Pseudomonadales bacterium]MDP6971627.1 hypothetical protein [Pseudomonadales bacterium]|tara:strand:- start:2757 stop:3383 length:627 start_codon:yes stop_codon:yes gene_type:complete